MKFAHLADCHIGAWRDPRLRALHDTAFTKAIDAVLEENVDFVIIAGDLFNTALPGIDHMNHAVQELMRLRKAEIPVYLVAGSHDYSPTGKSMLSVLETAGLCTNVFKGRVENDQLHLDFTTDPKTGVKLTGILGKAGQLDSKLYKTLEKEHLELEGGTKIFVFHTTLDELKPNKEIAGQPISFLPEGFNYYAGGHVHIVGATSLPGYADVVYPGPLFPASFSELEELGHGGLYIVDGDAWERKRIDLPIKKTLPVNIDCTGITPGVVEQEIISAVSGDVKDTIILMRLSGRLASGGAADIDFTSIINDCESRGAYAFLKNTVAVRSPEFKEIVMDTPSTEQIERKVVKEHLGQVPVKNWDEDKEEKLFHELLSTLSHQQHEGETKIEYEERVVKEAKKAIQ